jgi:serine/threonine protein kinase
MPAEVEDFLEKCLRFNPSTRLTITDALKHPLFDEIREIYEPNIEI